jgi:hypothetical protein
MKTVKHIAVSLFVINAGCASVPANAANENAVICQGCNYQQAQQLAIEHARPVLHCVTNDGGDVINIGNQSCTSQPKKIVIFDAASRRAFPFEVYHTNQGFNAFEMQVATRDRAIHQENLKLLNAGVDMQTNLNNSVHELAAAAIAKFPQLAATGSVLSAMSASYTTASTEDCSNDRDSAALETALSERTRAGLQQYVQERHREQVSSGLDAFMSYFQRNTASLSSVSFNLSKSVSGVSYGTNATFAITPKTTHFTAIYNTTSDIRFYATQGQSGWVGYPQLVYKIGPNADGTQVVKTDDEASFIDGSSLAAIKNLHNNAVPLEISPCLGLKLQQLNPNIQFDSPIPSGGGSDTGGGTGGGSGGGTGGGMCTMYGKVNGTIVLVMRVMC